MSAHFHAELGPFSVDVQLDDSGIHMQRGPLSPDAAQRIHELRAKVGEIIVAYRDSNGHASETEVPAPLTDAAFVQEFETRLGKRWLGESIDRQQAAKRLHTNPGFFASIFVLVALPGIIAAVAAVALLGLLGPALNFLSIQKMLLDLQDGNYASFVSHLGSYLALFAIGYLLHRVIRAKLDAHQGKLGSRRVIQH